MFVQYDPREDNPELRGHTCVADRVTLVGETITEVREQLDVPWVLLGARPRVSHTAAIKARVSESSPNASEAMG
ncbi:MAG: hypothetical protein LBS56_01560, partial [Propionibacteriaceae bacterium]|nr:hypothetical protein [Propionibacteriaceae bacterium]